MFSFSLRVPDATLSSWVMLDGGGLDLLSTLQTLPRSSLASCSFILRAMPLIAAAISKVGIFRGAGAKFKPFRRTDCSASVRVSEDRLTSHLFLSTALDRPSGS